MDRKKLETILKEHDVPFDANLESYHGYDEYGNDILIHFAAKDNTCYVCITDDPSNDCRGYSTDIAYDSIVVNDDKIIFTDNVSETIDLLLK